MQSLQQSRPHVTNKHAAGQLTFAVMAVEPEPEECWLPVPLPGWDGYDVSNMGRFRSWRVRGSVDRRADAPVVRKAGKVGKGYLSVKGGKHVPPEYIHRLVLFAFVGPCPEGRECRHLDGDKTNNRLTNLEWGTPEQNGEDKVRHGTMNAYREVVPEGPFECNDNFIPIEAIIPAEIWKPVAGFTKYDISNWGRLRSRHSSKLKAFGVSHALHNPYVTEKGYTRIVLLEDGVERWTSIHRLVIEAFSPQDDASLECRHLNGDPTDNHLANLRWGTHAENMADMADHGRSTRGTRSTHAKLNEDRVREIRRRHAAGDRQCHLAREFGVTQATICNLIKRRSWKHVV